MKRTGTKVRPLIIMAGTARVTGLPSTVASVLSTVNLITLVPLRAVTVRVAPSHSTVAFTASKMARSGAFRRQQSENLLLYKSLLWIMEWLGSFSFYHRLHRLNRLHRL